MVISFFFIEYFTSVQGPPAALTKARQPHSPASRIHHFLWPSTFQWFIKKNTSSGAQCCENGKKARTNPKSCKLQAIANKMDELCLKVFMKCCKGEGIYTVFMWCILKYSINQLSWVCHLSWNLCLKEPHKIYYNFQCWSEEPKSINQSINQLINQSINNFIYVSKCLAYKLIGDTTKRYKKTAQVYIWKSRWVT